MDKINEIKREIHTLVTDALNRFNGGRLVQQAVELKENKLVVKGKYLDLSVFNRILVIGFGKASGEMARALDKILGTYISDGVVIVPQETVKKYSNLKKIKVYGGTHPYPTSRNVDAAKLIVNMIESLSEDDLVICLISGGGSALLTLPQADITLKELRETTRLIMEAGGDIFELNTVRKHLSRVKGGQLARLAYPARLISLIISDVVGDDLSTIASGPTVPDPTTYQDALKILEKYRLLERVPTNVRRHLEKGMKGEIPETPKPGDPIFKKVENIIIGNNDMMLEYIYERMGKRGYNPKIITSYLIGEAREVGKVIASIGKMIMKKDIPFKKPIMLLFGGETTVTVKGNGRGGRNQELALSASMELQGYGEYIVCSVATDGIDGNSPAAGAIITNLDMKKALDKGLDPVEYLNNNDSYSFHSEINTAIEVGYTGTNVNDVVILAII